MAGSFDRRSQVNTSTICSELFLKQSAWFEQVSQKVRRKNRGETRRNEKRFTSLVDTFTLSADRLIY